MASGTRSAPAVGNAPSVTTRVPSPNRRSSSSISLVSASSRAARSARSFPASVSSIPRGTRSSSGTPTSRSRIAICWETAGWVRNSAVAAAVNEPPSATAAKMRSRRRSSIAAADLVVVGVPDQPFPSAEEPVVDAELIENLARGVRQQVVDRGGLMVEGGNRRHDHPAGQRHHFHVPDVNQVKRGLAGDQDKAPALLEAHGGATGQQ